MGIFHDVIDASFGPPRPSLVFPCDRGAHSQHADASDDHSFHGRMPKPRRPSNFSLSSWARRENDRDDVFISGFQPVI